jgi:hypothetical protein
VDEARHDSRAQGMEQRPDMVSGTTRWEILRIVE